MKDPEFLTEAQRLQLEIGPADRRADRRASGQGPMGAARRRGARRRLGRAGSPQGAVTASPPVCGLSVEFRNRHPLRRFAVRHRRLPWEFVWRACRRLAFGQCLCEPAAWIAGFGGAVLFYIAVAAIIGHIVNGNGSPYRIDPAASCLHDDAGGSERDAVAACDAALTPACPRKTMPAHKREMRMRRMWGAALLGGFALMVQAAHGETYPDQSDTPESPQSRRRRQRHDRARHRGADVADPRRLLRDR